MLKHLLFVMSMIAYLGVLAQTNHVVTAQNFSFSPANLTIQAGDMVTWNNTQGFHNTNGSQATFPNNPASFISGNPANAPWNYSFTFTVPGVYQYRCDAHPAMMTGTITVTAPNNEPALILTALFDGPLPNGLPKGFELYALDDIADLSLYGLGSANNGQGSDGVEYTFPAVSLSAGDFIYVTNDSAGFNQYFGFDANFNDAGTASNVNGDDAVELFLNGEVIDVFGDINVDGTGQPWEYLDGWAYRVSGTGPDGTTFVLGNWYFSGIDALDNTTTNATAPNPVPIGTYSLTQPEFVNAGDDDVNVVINTTTTLQVLGNDLVPGTLSAFAIVNAPSHGNAVVNTGNSTITYTPNTDFCGDDSFTYRICNAVSCDTATVAIHIECPVNYPDYTVAQVRSVNADGVADSLNVSCQLRGIVYGVDIRGGTGIQFTLIDNSGGIAVFSATLETYQVEEGDEVIVQGVIGQFNGLTQIIAASVSAISNGNALKQPAQVTALGENTESDLVKILNLTIVDPAQWTNAGTGFNVDVTDGVNTYSMRIDNDIDLYSAPAPTTPFNLTGLGGQFDNMTPFTEGYQLLPRYSADIEPITSVTNPEWSKDVRIYPNPASDVVTISMGAEVQMVILTDALGRELSRWNTPGQLLQFNMENRAAGVYGVRFVKNGELWQTKVVKQ